MTEHSRRLKKRAPCFFSICVPGLTEEFKMSVFFHTSNRVGGQFGLRVVIVAEEASAALMDRFESIAENIFTQLNLESTIERIEHLEKQMYTKQSKKCPKYAFLIRFFQKYRAKRNPAPRRVPDLHATIFRNKLHEPLWKRIDKKDD